MLLAFVISRKSRLKAAAAVSVMLLLTPLLFAAPPAIQIPRIDLAPTLADFEDMHPDARVAGQMLKVTGFIAREPADGAEPTQNTEVYLAYDSHNLYAAFLCWDKEPDKIRARMTRREDIFSDDSAEIMIDTFNDARRGYTFASNPLGIQWDALWTEGSIGSGRPADFSGFDDSFDTVWNSAGRLTGQGYIVLMSIPFKSLRFPSADLQQWRIILNRSIPRTNENLFWPRISNRIQGRFNQAATATGLDLTPARNIQLIPYGLLRGFRDIDARDPANPFFNSRTLQPEVGLDAKFILHDSFVLDATLNPDFSQVESDQPQITVNQRFEVFFPEKRPFFLENSNYFISPINMVFTRRIAHPEFGLRLTGKSGPWAIGILASDDRAPGEVLPPTNPHSGERATFAIARVSRDILDQSTIGATFTDPANSPAAITALAASMPTSNSTRTGACKAKPSPVPRSTPSPLQVQRGLVTKSTSSAPAANSICNLCTWTTVQVSSPKPDSSTASMFASRVSTRVTTSVLKANFSFPMGLLCSSSISGTTVAPPLTTSSTLASVWIWRAVLTSTSIRLVTMTFGFVRSTTARFRGSRHIRSHFGESRLERVGSRNWISPPSLFLARA